MLKIKNLSADKEPYTLTNINLEINEGEIHALIGPEHGKKSALVHSIAGWHGVNITDGSIMFNRKKINSLTPDARARLGIYSVFQGLMEFESFTNWELVEKIIECNKFKIPGLADKYKTCCELLHLGENHGQRQPNNFQMLSGEAKRNELIPMLLSNPSLIILDEIDNGMDDNEIVIAAAVIKGFLSNAGKSGLIVSNNEILLDLIEPTHVHVMVGGEIKLSGDNTLYKRIIKDGYSEFS